MKIQLGTLLALAIVAVIWIAIATSGSSQNGGANQHGAPAIQWIAAFLFSIVVALIAIFAMRKAKDP